jgi:hypothetical protein
MTELGLNGTTGRFKTIPNSIICECFIASDWVDGEEIKLVNMG